MPSGDRPGDPSDGRLELEMYLDGQLTGERLSTFERRLADDARLGAEVELQRALQRRIDGSLSRQFVAPPFAGVDHLLAPRVNGRAHDDAPVEQSPRLSGGLSEDARPQRARSRGVAISRPLAIAAMLALLLGVPAMTWLWWDMLEFGRPRVQYADTRAVALDVAYNEQLNAKRFKADWVCKTDDEFSNYFRDRLGQPLKMKPLTGNVADWGVSYTGGITPKTMGVLARIDGQPVVVFVDRRDADKGESFSAPCHLNMFRREVGELVLYEVSPFDQPRMLDLFYLPATTSN
jgi:hypothetical protein